MPTSFQTLFQVLIQEQIQDQLDIIFIKKSLFKSESQGRLHTYISGFLPWPNHSFQTMSVFLILQEIEATSRRFSWQLYNEPKGHTSFLIGPRSSGRL